MWRPAVDVIMNVALSAIVHIYGQLGFATYVPQFFGFWFLIFSSEPLIFVTSLSTPASTNF